MTVIAYTRREWGAAVVRLFSAIYPDSPSTVWERMGYDESLPQHLATYLAVKDGLPIGQLNVFRVAENAALANVGYHVHPRWHRRGIASLLLCTAWRGVVGALEDGLVILTARSNVALAEAAGFAPIGDELLSRYASALKLAAPDGVVFHLPRADRDPSPRLQAAASRAASALG